MIFVYSCTIPVFNNVLATLPRVENVPVPRGLVRNTICLGHPALIRNIVHFPSVHLGEYDTLIEQVRVSVLVFGRRDVFLNQSRDLLENESEASTGVLYAVVATHLNVFEQVLLGQCAEGVLEPLVVRVGVQYRSVDHSVVDDPQSLQIVAESVPDQDAVLVKRLQEVGLDIGQRGGDFGQIVGRHPAVLRVVIQDGVVRLDVGVVDGDAVDPHQADLGDLESSRGVGHLTIETIYSISILNFNVALVADTTEHNVLETMFCRHMIRTEHTTFRPLVAIAAGVSSSLQGWLHGKMVCTLRIGVVDIINDLKRASASGASTSGLVLGQAGSCVDSARAFLRVQRVVVLDELPVGEDERGQAVVDVRLGQVEVRVFCQLLHQPLALDFCFGLFLFVFWKWKEGG